MLWPVHSPDLNPLILWRLWMLSHHHCTSWENLFGRMVFMSPVQFLRLVNSILRLYFRHYPLHFFFSFNLSLLSIYVQSAWWLTFESHIAGVTVELFVSYPDFSSTFWAAKVSFTLNALKYETQGCRVRKLCADHVHTLLNGPTISVSARQ